MISLLVLALAESMAIIGYNDRAEALLQLRCIEVNNDWDATSKAVKATAPVCLPDLTRASQGYIISPVD